MNKRTARFIAGVAFVAAFLSGCGQKGPLYLPGEATEIVTRPAPAPASQSPEKDAAPNTPRSIDSPQGPPNPAPEVTAPEKEQKAPGAQAPR